ncbi:MAG TPA: DUF1295 domain-containing protein [Patescibacteria group bacterium]|nr:DUF1295 domain-containing protein [Patescibacteria group bacterium]
MAVILQTLAYAIAMRQKRVDIVDVFWGLSFIVIALCGYALSPEYTLSGTIVALLVVVWGLRLSWHIYRRFRRSSEQDPRYTDIIHAMPTRMRALQIYVRIFFVQAVLAWIISIPVLVAEVYGSTDMLWLGLGVIVWIIGFMFESIADRQLANFLQQNRGASLMTEGLWRYSRHPNYFGEITQWWGIWITTLMSPLSLLALVGPLAITILITKVSGIPLAEKRSQSRPGWKAYAHSTSVLIPMPPHR